MTMQRRARPLMGTFMEIAVESDCNDFAHEVISEGFTEATRLEALLSYFAEDSEITKINTSPAGQTIPVSPETLEILGFCETLRLQSQNLFSIGVGQELAAQGLRPMKSYSWSQRSSCLQRTIELLDAGVMILSPVTIDLGGVAKGFIVDKVLERIRRLRVASIIVNAGGDLRVASASPTTIRVPLHQCPLSGDTSLPLSFPLRSGAVATSGPYHTGRAERGLSSGALLNPHSGECFTEEKCVSVISGSCMISDALTKVVTLDTALSESILNHYHAAAWVTKISEGVPKTTALHPTHLATYQGIL